MVDDEEEMLRCTEELLAGGVELSFPEVARVRQSLAREVAAVIAAETKLAAGDEQLMAPPILRSTSKS
ncbi:hypothetical protein ACOMHN_050361 [Nucella lapillus]